MFSFDSTIDKLYVYAPLLVMPASRPRYTVFYSPSRLKYENYTLYLYVVTELRNTLTRYQVTYPTSGGLEFIEVYVTNTYSSRLVLAGNTVTKVHITPNNRFLVISNRNNSYFSIANPNPNNSTNILSDLLAIYSLIADRSLAFK